MLEAINIHSSVAVYLQIENQIRFAIARGELKAKDRLPSVQELAKRLDINFNTVTKAYRDLEVMGLIFTRRGMGCFVKDGAQEACMARCREEILSRIHEVTQEGKAAGISKKEMQEFLTKLYQANGPVYGDLPANVAALAKRKAKK